MSYGNLNAPGSPSDTLAPPLPINELSECLLGASVPVLAGTVTLNSSKLCLRIEETIKHN